MSKADNQLIDVIYKLYKNSSGDLLGIHQISVFEDREIHSIPGKISDTRFKRHAYIKTDFRRVCIVIDGSRIVDSVQFIGKYNDFTSNASNTDYISVLYLGNSETNSIEVGIEHLPTIGDTL